MTVRWDTTDDFTLQYRARHSESAWARRWDRYPNPHTTRDHVHPPPTAPTPGGDASWPDDHRDVVGLVLDEIEDRIAALWAE